MGERAVYYCRVSTEEENQQSSIRYQREESMRVIEEQGWELIDGYVDEGKSGTTTHGREEYKRMLRDMEAGRFDILVVKSQDRLMRNTGEWYRFLDMLTRLRKRLFFYLERRFYTPEDARLTGIKAILAEDYSRSLSRNINHAHERRQRSGEQIILTSQTWGYDKVHKQVVINEPEAEMIRRIYTLAAEGYGSRVIARMLEELGYRNRKGGRLAEQTIRRILRNPLYKGTAVMHRQHWDFESKRLERLDSTEWIRHDHAVPAIVSETLWQEVNEQMDQRRIEIVPRDGEKCHVQGWKCNQHLWSGKIRCGLCGAVYWRRSRRMKNGMCYYWCCSRYLAKGRGEDGCANIHLREQELEAFREKHFSDIGWIEEVRVSPGEIVFRTEEENLVAEVVSVGKRRYLNLIGSS